MPSKGFRIIILTLLTLVVIGLWGFFSDKKPQTDKTKNTSEVNKEIIGPEKATIIFVGDIMLDRYIRKMMDLYGQDSVLGCLDPLLSKADLVVGNLEGPITDNNSVSLNSKVGSPENFVFTFPTTSANFLKKHNIKLLNLGNNHINNFGANGMRDTKNYLELNDLNYFYSLGKENNVFETNINGINLSFINYNQFGGDSIQNVAKLIKSEKEGLVTPKNYIIVYTHWGEEYVSPTDQTMETAKIFADSGADLIVGSHPHVIQDHQQINKTVVYYSLGNFIFDQYFSPEVKTGLILLVTFKHDDLHITEKIVSLNKNGSTCLID